MQAQAGARQPAQVGPHAVVVLIILLIAVPMQLLLSTYLTQNGVHEESGQDIEQIRVDAVARLGEAAQQLMDRLVSSLDYYSSWGHLKELVLVPHKKKDKSNIHLKTTVIKSEKGTTTIVLTKDGKGQGNTDDKVKRQPELSTDTRSQRKKGEKSNSKVVAESQHSSQGTAASDKNVVNEETSPAKEVEDYLYREFYFSQSKDPRVSKPSTISYSVGQVVKHVTEGYYGVIIGWDSVARAPESWIETYYSDRKHVSDTPHYLVLVDSHFDASGTPYHYVPQEDLELVHSNIQVQCPEMNKYFEGYKDGHHIPKPWLRSRYPKD